MRKLFLISIIIFGSLMLIGCSEKVEKTISFKNLICKDDFAEYRNLSDLAQVNVSYYKNGYFGNATRNIIMYEDEIYYKNIIYKLLKKRSKKISTATRFGSWPIINSSYDDHIFEEVGILGTSYRGKINKASFEGDIFYGYIRIFWPAKQTKTGKHAEARIKFSCKLGKSKL